MGAVQRLASVAVNDGIAAADEAMAEIQRPILRSADFLAAVASYRDSNRPGRSRAGYKCSPGPGDWHDIVLPEPADQVLSVTFAHVLICRA